MKHSEHPIKSDNKEHPIKSDNKASNELTWFWCKSDSETGWRSSWTSLVNVLCFGQGAYSDPYSTRILNAIGKKRRIEAILRQIPEYNQYVLYSLYGHSFYNVDIEKVCKSLAGPACCQMHHDELATLCKKSISNVLKASEKALLRHILEQAEKDKKESLEMYSKASKDKQGAKCRFI
jgi:hypothetical protein